MKIKNWRLYTADNEFIVNLKILLKSTLILIGGVMILLLIMSLLVIYGHNVINTVSNIL